MFTSKVAAVALPLLAGITISACHNDVAALSASQEGEQASQSAQSTGTNWHPGWNTAPDKSRKVKTRLVPEVGFADDGFRGSPIFENQEQKTRNAQAREAFEESFPSVPECSGINLNAEKS